VQGVGVIADKVIDVSVTLIVVMRWREKPYPKVLAVAFWIIKLDAYGTKIVKFFHNRLRIQ
jgi:hypothetical protein